jgi:hypothetical protein
MRPRPQGPNGDRGRRAAIDFRIKSYRSDDIRLARDADVLPIVRESRRTQLAVTGAHKEPRQGRASVNRTPFPRPHIW